MLDRYLPSLSPALAVAALSLILVGCSGTDGNNNQNGEQCSEPTLRHSPSPFNFLEAFPPKEGEENRGDRKRTPFEATFHLRSKCDQNVEVTKTCLVGEGEEAGDDRSTEHFSIEGPVPSTVEQDQDSVVRVTYTREQANSGDDADNAAMVIQSNAGNLPTLVVPICARVISEGGDTERQLVTCDSPVEVPAAGEKKEGLCKN